jgi:galactose mutarotase-like enzyme
MKDRIIRSDRLTVYVNQLGAELKGAEMDGLEYLWQGEKDIYGRTSPTLFPIIGRFLSDTYYVGDKAYHMPINGIVMDRNFACLAQEENRAVFRLAADARTLAAYPFEFELTVAYTAVGNKLHVDYRIENHGESPMPFCVGCHTAYNWPLMPEDQPEDYRLRFEQPEELESFNPFGWRQPFVQGELRPLSHDLFSNYTRSLTGMRSKWVQFESARHGRHVRIHRENFPYMAIWTLPTPEAALICLEPCTGIHAGDRGCTRLEDRLGALMLAPRQVWQKGFSLEFA